MAVHVFLGDAEVDVEEQRPTDRRSLRLAAVEERPKPRGMDELPMVCEALDRKLPVCPIGEAFLVDARAGGDVLLDPTAEHPRSVEAAVDDHLVARRDALALEHHLEL